MKEGNFQHEHSSNQHSRYMSKEYLYTARNLIEKAIDAETPEQQASIEDAIVNIFVPLAEKIAEPEREAVTFATQYPNQ